MGRKVSLTADNLKTKRLSEGSSAIKISKELKRDPKAVLKIMKHFVHKVRSEKCRSMSSSRDMRKLSPAAKKYLHTSKGSLEEAGIVKASRQMRSTILKKITKIRKSQAMPHTTRGRKLKRVSWAKKYLKPIFFLSYIRATLDVPDGWSHGWTLYA